MAATRQLKQQITDLLMNEKGILNSIAEVVSSTIIDKLLHSEAAIQKVAVNIVQNTLQNCTELESLEQYGRRNCLLIHGVAERSNELTEDTEP